MTLEEQIRPHTQYWDCYNDCPLEYNHTGKVLKIINEFVIGFGEYLDSLTTEDMGKLSIEKLLLIYKKEKGL
jgi:hypothetical protein